MLETVSSETPVLSNAEIADKLSSLAQLLLAAKENPYKVKAYQRAATKLRTLSDSVDELVRDGYDLKQHAGIGTAISSAIREIVLTGTLRKLDELRSHASPEMAGISEYPRLDPLRVLRIYKKLGIHDVESLKQKLASGEIEKALGLRMAQHVRQGLIEVREMLLYKADEVRAAVEEFLLTRCPLRRAEVAGDYRRRVEVVEDLVFVIETDDFPTVISRVERYGGRTPLLRSSKNSAVFGLSSGIRLQLQTADSAHWGITLIACTGSKSHLRKLTGGSAGMKALLRSKDDFPNEAAVYKHLGVKFIEPELREGHDEVDRAAQADLPVLVTRNDIRGELHAHSTSSDGSNSIEQMADAARVRGYEYIGITDHSQSLKIARGVSVEDLWKQIRFIDKLNERTGGIRILKSAEVDILTDGSLDYPDDLLKELDYTVCSIHSRFGLGKTEQTERILRAMDNRNFRILGHATGRLLLKRPGYEIDLERIIAHAKANGCFFEINSSPDRLDLSAESARAAMMGGVKIAISTDAHSTRELELIRYGIDQGRRAWLSTGSVLNCQRWETLREQFKR